MDIKNVGLVIHFEKPLSFDHYIHRAGRSARGLNAGNNLVLVGSKQSSFLRQVKEYHNESCVQFECDEKS